jgi:hypothetical protein
VLLGEEIKLPDLANYRPTAEIVRIIKWHKDIWKI